MPYLTIDALPLLERGGITNYVTPFACELVRQAAPSFSPELLFRTGSFGKRKKAMDRVLASPPFSGVPARSLAIPDALASLLWEQGRGIAKRSPEGGDLFIATTELVPRSKTIVVGHIVYDIVPLMIPEKFSFDQERYKLDVFNRLIRSDFVIAISETTKRDLVNYFNYPSQNITVVYPGCPAHNASVTVQENDRQRPFILSIGALAPNKNIDGIVRVFARCIKEHRLDYDLVLVGKDFCGQAYWRDLTASLDISNRVHFHHWVSNEKREYLLSRAVMLWQFSWYEGFGLPVLEAAARGTPVLYANRGSLAEILRNPDQEIDPAHEEQSALKAASVLQSPRTLETWKQHGLKRAALFSWERSIQAFLSWYREFDHGKT
ncbi:MAG: glycosyltransferase family 4 protein [Chitinispirillaceae bacterium]|nr:glycosyltransferase family 4 protein [Chitinispirillaceae bacterium]